MKADFTEMIVVEGHRNESRQAVTAFSAFLLSITEEFLACLLDAVASVTAGVTDILFYDET